MIEALKDLHDIHTPAPINDWWPLAPGIQLLLVIFLGLGLYTLWYQYTRKARILKKMALAELSALELAYKNGVSASETAAGVSMLLKRVSLLFYPREKVAALEGEDWLIFLSNSSKKLDFTTVRHPLLYLAYTRNHQTATELPLLFNLSRRWIKQRSHRCLS